MNYVICHTHWDREWFAPSSVTNKWLKELFEKLFDLIQKDKSYTYVLDGQTLILEDLLSEAPQLENKLIKFIRSGNLLIGPFYAQIDFRISPESAIVKNLEIGRKDTKKFGAGMKVAWMVDNFGFISQLPQLLKRYDIQGAFLFRGVNFEKPSLEFLWRSQDGSQVKCIFLISGYRNLYGLSFTKSLAKRRLDHEVEKLKPFSLSGLIPLLDGYDLDTNPEDPLKFLKNVIRSSPDDFLNEAFSKSVDFPVVYGELMSGKYACVFPGTLSTRVYLKRQSYVVGKLLKYVELLGFLNGEDTEDLYRTYLKTLIHDNICGVGIDTVHRNMQRTYRKMYSKLKKSFVEHLSKITGNLESGKYVLSFSPFDYDLWYCDGKKCYKFKSDGAGIFKVKEFDRLTKDRTLSFKNRYYEAQFCEDGTLKINNLTTGILNLQKELADSYSTYTKKMDFSSRLLKIEVEQSGEKHKIVRLQRVIRARNILIKTQEKVIFDQSPLVKWQINVDTKGKEYLLSFVTKTGDTDSQVFAKMPFDIVQRKRTDKDLLGTKISKDLTRVLMAARETDSVNTFPFQGFVAFSARKTTSVMAKGVYQYTISKKGDIQIDLVRSVEWIAKANVKGRTGDAGPLMYIPDARCEGKMSFEMAICQLKTHVRSEEFIKWFTLFDDSPMRISIKNENGKSQSLRFFSSKFPWVCLQKNEIVVYNPYSKTVGGLKPKEISSMPFVTQFESKNKKSDLRVFDFPAFPSFISRENVSQKTLNSITRKIKIAKENIVMLENHLKKVKVNSEKYHLLKHRILSKKRTILELKICLFLNKGRVPEKLMKQLNRLRSKKRIYDYVVELLKEGRR